MNLYGPNSLTVQFLFVYGHLKYYHNIFSYKFLFTWCVLCHVYRIRYERPATRLLTERSSPPPESPAKHATSRYSFWRAASWRQR
jgi:hypothetical protein